LDTAIHDHVRRGKPLLGICGGYQMLGRTIVDADGVEGEPGVRAEGLGILDVHVDFAAEKTLGLPRGEALGAPASGYEIHHGRVSRGSGEQFLGGTRVGNVFATMWHGSLEGDELRGALLEETLGRPRSGVSFARAREARFDRLGDLVDEHLDVDGLLALARSGAPPVPAIPPGGATCDC
ncbi:MAG TPA: cobyric acid synthase CobQ, partial [Nocardioidaceae bacterium]|nr:cobyric acid synthase CobQ [Nocardioidaceae bacterium]